MDEEEKREDSLTEDEERDVERDDMSGEEAHRAGEFDDLRDMLDTISDTISDKIDSLGTELSNRIDSIKQNATAMAVENGAIVREDDGGDIPEEIPELEELDLSI